MTDAPSIAADCGSRIRQARVAARLTQKGLADLIGRSQSTVNDWEHGTTEPSLAYLQLIARVTETAPCWLAFGTEETPSETRAE